MSSSSAIGPGFLAKENDMLVKPEMQDEYTVLARQMMTAAVHDGRESMYGAMVMVFTTRWANSMEEGLKDADDMMLSYWFMVNAKHLMMEAEESFAEVSPEGSLTEVQRALGVVILIHFWAYGQHLLPLFTDLTFTHPWEQL